MNIKLFLLSALSISVYMTEAASLNSLRHGALQPRALLRSLMNGEIANGLLVHCDPKTGTIIRCNYLNTFEHSNDAPDIESNAHLVRPDLCDPLTGDPTGALIIGSKEPHLLSQKDINEYTCSEVQKFEDALTTHHIQHFKSRSTNTEYLPKGFMTEHFAAKLFATRSLWPHRIGTNRHRTFIPRRSLMVYSLVNARLSLQSPLGCARIVRATMSSSNHLLLKNCGYAVDSLTLSDLQAIAHNNFEFIPEELPVLPTDVIVVGPAATQITTRPFQLEMALSFEDTTHEFDANGERVN